jgi:peptidoglycan/LPS O-acetylase OafA/YrhL
VNGVMHDLFFKKPPSFQDFPTILVTLLAFLVTYLLAYFTYLAYEKRFIAFGHKYSYRPDYDPA